MGNISQPQSFVLATDLLQKVGGDLNVSATEKFPDLSVIANQNLLHVQWNISGVFLYDRASNAFCNFILGAALKIKIETFSGSPPCVWSLEWFSMRNIISPVSVVERLRALSTAKPNFVLHFDNPFIEENTLDDTIGNSFLRLCSEMPEMHVCVASELLAEKIRKTFPQAKLHAGVNKVIAEEGRGNIDYYLNAAEKYFRVAIHPEDLSNVQLLEMLAKKASPDKFEITVNDTCLRSCPLRREHLKILAKMRLAPWDAKLMQERHELLGKAMCENVQNVFSKEPSRCAAILTRTEILKIYELGFRHFRIQAETLRNEMSYFWELARWMISDSTDFWENQGMLAAAISSNVIDDVPVLKNGKGAFLMRKYD